MRLSARFALLMVVIGASAPLLSGCAGGHHDPQHTLEISDITGSALNPHEQLNLVAKNEAVSLVQDLRPGDTLTIYAFGRTLTSACDPITADFARQGNTEEQDQLKTNLSSAVAARYDEYVSCLRNVRDGGSPGGGSPIFGAIVEAVQAAQGAGRITAIDLITDGCTWDEGTPSCSVATASRPRSARKFVAALPASLKPDLSGIPITITGLGRGTYMSSAQLSVLRQIFYDYAKATGTTVEFR